MNTSPAPQEIRAARRAAHLSQTEAAGLVHSKLRTWQQWEAGDRSMHPGLWELFQLKVMMPVQSRPEPLHTNHDTNE